MKKLLLATTAMIGVAMLASPASAKLNMSLGGYFKGYGVYSDSNEVGGAAADLRKYDFRRDTEVHFNGESTLDNGLTVGTHVELKALADNTTAPGTGHNAAAATASVIDEAYAYFSGGWGRVNFGSADGAAYLLQVNAPSADSNADGMRVFISALTKRTAEGTAAPNTPTFGTGTLWTTTPTFDYQHADARQTDRLTYLTPKFNGFQGGISYAPKLGMAAIGGHTGGQNIDNDGVGVPTHLWEASARWDGEFQGTTINVGAGYSDNSTELSSTSAQQVAMTANQTAWDEGVRTWNAGLSLANSGFSLGGVYRRADTERIAQTLDAGDLAANVASGDVTRTTWVVGLGYDNGPYHVGGSYLHQKSEYDAIAVGANAQNVTGTRYTNTKYGIGGGYTYGPGMTFRGSVAWGKFDATDLVPAAADDNRFTQVAIGTDIKF